MIVFCNQFNIYLFYFRKTKYLTVRKLEASFISLRCATLVTWSVLNRKSNSNSQAKKYNEPNETPTDLPSRRPVYQPDDVTVPISNVAIPIPPHRPDGAPFLLDPSVTGRPNTLHNSVELVLKVKIYINII